VRFKSCQYKIYMDIKLGKVIVLIIFKCNKLELVAELSSGRRKKLDTLFCILFPGVGCYREEKFRVDQHQTLMIFRYYNVSRQWKN